MFVIQPVARHLNSKLKLSLDKFIDLTQEVNWLSERDRQELEYRVFKNQFEAYLSVAPTQIVWGIGI